MLKCLHSLGVFLLNVIIVSRVQYVSSNLNVFILNALIVLLVLLYSGINACEVTRRVSGGECDGFRVPTASPPTLSDGRQAQQGLVTDVTLYHNPFNVLQMAAPRAAIWFHLATGGRCLCGHHACVPH